MKNLGKFLVAGALLASLAGCGKSEDANQPAAPDTVEMPADELPSGDPSMAAPEGDGAMAPAGDASGAVSAADAAQSAADSAKAAAEEAKAAKAATGPAAKSADGN